MRFKSSSLRCVSAIFKFYEFLGKIKRKPVMEYIPLGMGDIVIRSASVAWEVHPRGIPAAQGVGLWHSKRG